MQAACSAKEQENELRKHQEAEFARQANASNELAQVVDLALKHRLKSAATANLRELDAQIAEKRQREAAERSSSRASTPIVFPFSDQHSAKEKSRTIAKEFLEQNRQLLQRRKAASRVDLDRERDVEEASILRSRDEATHLFLQSASAKREQRSQLQTAWRAQLILKYGSQ